MTLSGRIVPLTIESRALRGNPLSDPHVRDVLVWLPPGHDGMAPRLPVIWVLPAFTGTAEALLHDTPWSPGLPRRLAGLVASGAMEPVIVAMPDCWTRLGGSQYLDSSATGRYETFLMEEALPAVERAFPVIPGGGARGILGRSSGGFGALRLAMKHPGAFAAVACHSGDMHFDVCYRRAFPAMVDELNRAGGLDSFLARFDAAPRKSGRDIATIELIAMSAVYSPDPDAPGRFVLPCDPETAEIREDVFARWLAHDPLVLAEQHAPALRTLRLLFIDAGSRDEYFLHLGARALHRRLEALAVPHRFEEYDDGHGGTSYRYERSFPLVALALLGTAVPGDPTGPE